MSQGQARLKLLGGVDLCDADGLPIRAVLAQPKRLALLIYLRAGPAALHRRDTLLAMFWPEADDAHARGSLNRAVYFLRQQLGAELIITHGDDVVGVAADRLECDVKEFESELSDRPAEALELYQGDLAPGFLVAEAPGFETWLDQERTRFRTSAAEAALRLARDEAGPGGLARAERWAERATTLAPFDERAARIRMTLLDRLGDRALALRVYDELDKRLQTELEVAPSPETVALSGSIRARAEPRPLVREPEKGAAPQSQQEPVGPPFSDASSSPGFYPAWRAFATVGAAGGLALAVWMVAGSARHWSAPTPEGPWAQVTSEEGLDFEPALSPDGREVAYATRRDGRMVIAVRSATGLGASGELLPALKVEGNQGLPVWSTDGELIRFTTIAENQPAVWWEVGRMGGTPRRLPLPRMGRWVAWTGDGGRVAIVANDSFFVTSRGDPGVRAIPFSAGVTKPHSLAWSPDEHWIAFVDLNVLWPIGPNTSTSTLLLLDPARGRVVPVTDDHQLNVSPVWLDDRTLMFVSNRDGLREVYAIQIGPEGPRGQPHKVAGGTGVHSISVSANRSRLALSRMEVRTELRRFTLGPGPAPGLASGETLLNGNQKVESHDVSPDGHWLLFDSNRRGGADLFKLELNADAGPTPLFTGPGDQFFPQWSPDGREAVYYGGPGPTALWIIAADGGTPTRLSDSGEVVANPRWSPDGLSLAYTSEQNHQVDVWLRSRRDHAAEWGPKRRLTDHGCYLAAWSPTGDGIICRTADGRGINLVARDGTVRWRRDLISQGFTRNPMVVSSPGDRDLYFLGKRGAEEGIWAWPLEGGAARLVLRADIPGLDLLGYPGSLTVNRGRMVTTIGRVESDIWVTDLH